ncbi:hypothetical protein [Nonomuraea jabiensis]|uniref:Uncharacterized protein n=1 Tax=Nonomuraea jabiensis TaxID=882448 RepID=A0A7W9LFT9_9ACTN|nr:hypothetical protein [Nonomuraea jabiensis]MBB5782247.1 hypothetical protein [Nonomuraea jabiensis]
MTSLSIAFGTAVAGVLVNLGGGSMLDSARYVLFGLALLCASGALTAHAVNRTDPALTAHPESRSASSPESRSASSL